MKVTDMIYNEQSVVDNIPVLFYLFMPQYLSEGSIINNEVHLHSTLLNHTKYGTSTPLNETIQTRLITISPTFELQLASDGTPVQYRVIHLLESKGGEYLTVLGLPLLMNVIYTIYQGESVQIYCPSTCTGSSVVEIFGSPSIELLQRNDSMPGILKISAIIQNERKRAYQLLNSPTIEKQLMDAYLCNLATMNPKTNVNIKPIEFIEELKNYIIRKDTPQSVLIPRVLVLGPGSFQMSQLLCNLGVQEDTSPLFVQLNPLASTINHYPDVPLETFKFPPGVIGAVRTSPITASLGYRVPFTKSNEKGMETNDVIEDTTPNFKLQKKPKRKQTEETVSRTIVSLLADNVGCFCNKNHHQLTPSTVHLTGRLSYVVGTQQEEPLFDIQYIHFLRMLAGSIAMNYISTMETIFEQKILASPDHINNLLQPPLSSETFQSNTLCQIASGLILNGPSDLGPSLHLLREIVTTFQITTILVVGNINLFQQIASEYHYVLPHYDSPMSNTQVSVLAVCPLSQIPLRIHSTPTFWNNYFYGPPESVSFINSQSLNDSHRLLNPIEIDITIDDLKIVAICVNQQNGHPNNPYHNDQINSQNNTETDFIFQLFNHIQIRLVQQTTLQDLETRILAIVCSDSMDAVAWTPISGFVWVKHIRFVGHHVGVSAASSVSEINPTISTNSSQWVVTLLCPFFLRPEFIRSAFFILTDNVKHVHSTLNEFVVLDKKTHSSI